jgi:hypothetical protein
MIPVFSVAWENDDGRVVAQEKGLYAIRYDAEREIIRIARLGVQNVDDVERYLKELSRVVCEMRARCGRVRLLADLRYSPVRTSAVAERIRVANLALYRPGDRVALLVESSLLKMQLRRNLVPDYQNIFLSPTAAEIWLAA